jgi:hypothetical protein
MTSENGGGCRFGLAIPAGSGQWRTEIEGRQRARLAGQASFVGDPVLHDVQATDGWSVTANLSRDIAITERTDFYVGGGGYRLSVNDQIYASGYDRVAEFAWQAGGGLIWNASDRLHRLRCAQLFSESRAPPAVLHPAALRARTALRDPRCRRSHPLRDAPAQGRQLRRPWPRAEVHAARRARLGRALAV